MVRFRTAILLGRPLPAWWRERVFEAAYNELLGDYLTARVGVTPPIRWRLRARFEARALKYAIRQLLGAPAFSATAILIVAIGIGANTAAFSVVNAMLFRPQPFARPAELVDIYQDSDDGEPNSSSFPAYRDIAAYDDLFTGVAATFVTSTSLQREDGLSRALVEFSTSNYMEVLGLRPAIGRWFTEVDRADTERVAVISDSLSLPRLDVRFLGGFGFVALVLASLGLYGVVSFAVGRRMLEVGVRMALGAQSGQVIWLVLREVAALVCIGIVVGLGLSVAATAALAGVLFDVSPTDPLTLAMVAVILLAVAMGAAMIPALRAAKADPVLALRQG